MQMIIDDKSSGKIKINKLEIKINKLSKAKIKIKIDKAKIFLQLI